tara:strand:- start:34054 stop:34584 length:531 start_codon:yes stop_codon:yes gene_type:complete
MKHLKEKLLFAVCVMFCVTIAMGQTYKEEEENGTQLRDTENTTLQELQLLGIDNSPNPRNAEITGNAVFVRQIGEFNQANFKIAANASEININQNGDNNLADLEYQVNTAVTNLQQNGDFNTLVDFVIDGTEDVSLDLEQNGDGMYFERFGSNAITRSLRFKQTEASPTIIVRSFN